MPNKFQIVKRKIKWFVGKVSTYFLLSGLFVATVYPLYWAFITSFKENFNVFRNPLGLPQDPTLQNYIEVWTVIDFPQYFLNSVIITGGALFGILIISTMAGYGFARFDFPGSEILFNIFIASMVVIPASIMVAEYEVIDSLGLLNTRIGVILVFLSWSVFGIVMSCQAFSEVPQHFIDAAKVDGAGEFRIFAIILTPLIRPTIATVTIFTGVWVWNDFLWPLVLLQNPSQQTVILGVLSMKGQYLAAWGTLTAGLISALVPTLLLYFAFQRHFVKGLKAGGLKQ